MIARMIADIDAIRQAPGALLSYWEESLPGIPFDPDGPMCLRLRC